MTAKKSKTPSSPKVRGGKGGKAKSTTCPIVEPVIVKEGCDSGGRKPAGIVLDASTQTPARNPTWLVVRCPGSETLEFEKALVEQDVGVWTPSLWVRKRLPRRRLKVWAQYAILPSYLFMRIEDLPKFGGLPFEFKADLSPMKILGRYVVLNDMDLEGLRELDQREAPDRKVAVNDMRPKEPDPVPPAPPSFSLKQMVRIGGLLDGAEGSICTIHSDGDYSVALKNSPTKVKVSGFLLKPIDVYSG